MPITANWCLLCLAVAACTFAQVILVNRWLPVRVGSSRHCGDSASSPAENSNWRQSETAAAAAAAAVLTFNESMSRLGRAMRASLYRYDRTRRLVVMQLGRAERNRSHRIQEARRWLRTQRLVVGAAVRNAMNGIRSTHQILHLLSGLFKSVHAVFVENDSEDGTRDFLHSWSQGRMIRAGNLNVTLLGCDVSINSKLPCRLGIAYPSSGRRHRAGQLVQVQRSLAEESTDRGLVMAALRNMYLDYIYRNVSGADLLLVLEADIDWASWDGDDVAQGLYYFKAKPRLDSLCALATFWSPAGDQVQDPCTLLFHPGRHFYADAPEAGGAPFLGRNGEQNLQFQHLLGMRRGQTDLPKNLPAEPLKVAACFQGAAFYRLSRLRGRDSGYAYYRYSEGEWHCEHTTLALQLRENYLDTRMRLRVGRHPVG